MAARVPGVLVLVFLPAVAYASNGVVFTENRGQFVDDRGVPAPRVLFKGSGPGHDIFITDSGLTYSFRGKVSGEESRGERDVKVDWSRVDVDFSGATIDRKRIERDAPAAGVSHYYYAHAPAGIRDVKSFGRVVVRDLYPGIDWVIDGGERVKQSFIVRPGADPRVIVMRYSGATRLERRRGGLRIVAPHGFIDEGPLVSRQGDATVASSYAIDGGTVRFAVPKWNRKLPLLIDPPLRWSTAYGGSDFDGPMAIAEDGLGNVTITGYTYSVNLPMKAGTGYYQGTISILSDAILLHFNHDGVRLWTTYYGGTDDDKWNGVAVDAAGNIAVTGVSASFDLPLWNAFQPTKTGPPPDALVALFTEAGAPLWASYLGGIEWENGAAVAIANQRVVVTGVTCSYNFPVWSKTGAHNESRKGVCDAFVTELTMAGVPTWSTCYGASDWDEAKAIAVHASGGVTIGGLTHSSDLAVVASGTQYGAPYAGFQEGFLASFNAAGALTWATHYGGSHHDYITSLSVDPAGRLFAAGPTGSTDLPTQTAGEWFMGSKEGQADFFIVRFDENGALTWGTHFGGPSIDNDRIVLDARAGPLYVAGRTFGADAPLLKSSGEFDSTQGGIFLTRFDPTTTAMEWSTLFGSKDEFPTGLTGDGRCLFLTGEFLGIAAPIVDPGGGAYMQPQNAGKHDGLIAQFCFDCPAITAGPDRVICQGGCTTLGPPSPPPGYTWSWTPLQWMGPPDAANPSACFPSPSTTYTMVATNPTTGCTTTDQVTITAATVVPADAGPDQVVPAVTCKGTGQTTIGTAGIAGYTYQWSPADHLSSTTTPVVTVTRPPLTQSFVKIYTVIAVSPDGCMTLDTVKVTFGADC